MKTPFLAFGLLAVLFVFSGVVYSQEFENTEVVVMNVPKVAYPKEAKATGLGGKVSVVVHVDEKGTPVSVEEASGPDWVCPQVQKPDVVALRNAVKAAAMKAKFKPAMANGVAVASTVPLIFQIGDSGPLGSPDYYDSHPKSGKKEQNYSAVTVGEQSADAEGKTSGAQVGPPQTLSGGVLNRMANKLPLPNYPAAARAVRATGSVPVQVLIDTDGTMLSAKAVSGHPLLQAASRDAACRAAFTPTLLSGQPVRVSGIITYNFVP